MSLNCKEHGVRLEGLGGGGATDAPAVLQAGVLRYLDIRAGRDAWELFANGPRELGYVIMIEFRAARSFSFATVSPLFGVRG